MLPTAKLGKHGPRKKALACNVEEAFAGVTVAGGAGLIVALPTKVTARWLVRRKRYKERVL